MDNGTAGKTAADQGTINKNTVDLYFLYCVFLLYKKYLAIRRSVTLKFQSLI